MQTKVLIVDDSPTMRLMLKRIIESDPQFKVIGFASNGKEAIEKIKQLKPDVVTMDVEMPVMDGVEAVRRICIENPVPIVMVSALTRHGAEVTTKALTYGAVDFILKPGEEISFEDFKEDLIFKLKIARRVKVIKRVDWEKFKHIRKERVMYRPEKKIVPSKRKIVVIGSSTGGPSTLHTIFGSLEPPGVPIVIAQHMPMQFTKILADHLNKTANMKVIETQGGERLEPDVVYVGKGNHNVKITRGGRIHIEYEPGLRALPSVDLLFSSAAEVYGAGVVAVILTGMGKDGLEGAKKIKQKGGKIIAQNEESCVVYGMPRAVVEAGLADKVAPPETIPFLIKLMLN